MSDNSTEAICAITLTPLSQLSDDQKMFLPCSHGFDKEAIQKHLARVSEECPVCRTSIHVSVSSLGVETSSPEVEDCKMKDDESDSEDEEEFDDDMSSATLNSEEPRSEETGSMGSLVDFIEDDEANDEDSFVASDESDDTITSEVESDEEEYEGSDSEDDSDNDESDE